MQEAAKSIVEALKASPALLALIVLMAFVFVGIIYSLDRRADRDHAETMVLLQNCLNGKSK
jgi:hypothetical protein